MSFNDLDVRELDKDLSPEQAKEWNAIYASYRSRSLLNDQVVGLDVISLPEPEAPDRVIHCLVVIHYRVKVLIPETEVWFDSRSQRPLHVLRSVVGAHVDYIIQDIDRIGECCTASRSQALQARRGVSLKRGVQPGQKVDAQILAVGRTHLLATCMGFDMTLSQRDLSYAMIPDLRDRYRPGEVYAAVVKAFDPEEQRLSISIKEAEPHPFDGAEVRHPLQCRRISMVTGKYKGGVFCRLEDNLDCLCTYSAAQYDDDFHIGDPVIVAVTKFNYELKQVYGKILRKI